MSAATRNGVTLQLYSDQAGASPVTLPVSSSAAVTYYVPSHGAVHLTIAQPDGTDLSRDALCTAGVLQTVAPGPSLEQLAADAGGGGSSIDGGTP